MVKQKELWSFAYSLFLDMYLMLDTNIQNSLPYFYMLFPQ